MNIRYEVETHYDDAHIRQLLWVADRERELLQTRIIRLQEQGIRDALIKLGWTPPPKEQHEPPN